MIFKEAKDHINKLIKDWNTFAGEDIRIRNSRYYILVGGLMYTDDVEKIDLDVVGELEYTQMMNKDKAKAENTKSM